MTFNIQNNWIDDPILLPSDRVNHFFNIHKKSFSTQSSCLYIDRVSHFFNIRKKSNLRKTLQEASTLTMNESSNENGRNEMGFAPFL